MAQNVVGTFATMSDAESAVLALREIGITDDEMTVVPHTADAADAEATTALAQSAAQTAEQEGRPVPEAVAEVAAHGPKREGGYIIVRVASDDAAARATEIMERYQAVDLESRGQQYEPGDWTHVDDPNALAAADSGATQSMASAATAQTDSDFATQNTISSAPATPVDSDVALVNPISDDTIAQPGSDALTPPSITRISRIYAASSLPAPAQSVPATSELSAVTAPSPDMEAPVGVATSPTSGVDPFAATAWNAEAGFSQQTEESESGLLAILQRPLVTLLIGVALGFGLAQLFKKERDA